MEYCEDCPDGTRPNRRHTKCEPVNCRDGQEFSSFYLECRQCTGNEVRRKITKKIEKHDGSFVCTPCTGRGVAQTNLVMPKTECRLCPPGKFIHSGYEGTCMPCPNGTTTRGKGKRDCRHKVTGKCTQKNMFVGYEGDCNRCDMGSRYAKKVKRCIKCPPNSTSTGGLSTTCIKCGPNEVVQGAECICVAGSVHRKRDGKCVKCPRGSEYSVPGLEQYFPPYCSTCSVGSYSETPGSMECKDCPAGSSSWTTKGKRCVRSPKCKGGGWILQDIYANGWTREGRCVSRTTGCPRSLKARSGAWGVVYCANGKGKPVCPKGTYVNISSGQPLCIPFVQIP